MSTKNQDAINAALSKLTIEERELLGLIKKPKKPRVRKNYTLKILYMIGDADGHTDEEAVISASNPFLKPLTEALDKLGEIKGHWGIMFDREHINGNKELGRLTDFEYDLLCLVVGINNDINAFFEKYNYDVSEQNDEYIAEFEMLFFAQTEYSFLTYQGYKLR